MSEREALGPLRPGDRVGVVATSTPPDHDRLDASLEKLKSWGLVPVEGEHLRKVHPRAKHLAGTDEQRAEDLMRAWTDDSLAAVFCVRGGMGSLRITELLDAELLRAARPKALIGSSDVTGLHEYWERHVGVPTWFAPMLATKDLLESQQNIDQLHEALFTPHAGRVITAPDAASIVTGEEQGVLTGGNLTLIRQARELDRYPESVSAEGRIVLLEDVGEAPWRLDGQLMGLLHSGYLDGAKGIALGTWDKCGDLDDIRMLLEDHLSPLGIPLVWGLPFGHGAPVETVPLGVEARLVADSEHPRLELL